jgi:hypothetical protein
MQTHLRTRSRAIHIQRRAKPLRASSLAGIRAPNPKVPQPQAALVKLHITSLTQEALLRRRGYAPLQIGFLRQMQQTLGNQAAQQILRRTASDAAKRLAEASDLRDRLVSGRHRQKGLGTESRKSAVPLGKRPRTWAVRCGKRQRGAAAVWAGVTETASSVWETVKSAGTAAWSAAKSLGSKAWNLAKESGSKAWNWAKGMVVKVMEGCEEPG